MKVTDHDIHFLDKLCTAIPFPAAGCLFFLEHLDLWIQLLTFLTLGFSCFWWCYRFYKELHK